MRISPRALCPCLLFLLTSLASCEQRAKNQLDGIYVSQSGGTSARLRVQSNHAGDPEIWTPGQYGENMNLGRKDGTTITTLDPLSGKSIFVIQDNGDLLQVLDCGVAANRTFRKQAQASVETAKAVPAQQAALAPKSPDPRAEALSAAEKEWAKAWIQDGETWIARSADRPYLLQIRGKRTEVSADQLSEADRLNGIQWLGSVEVFFAAKRQFGLQSYSGLSGRFQAGWNKWETDERPLAIYNFKKEAGRWTLLEHTISQSHALGFIQDKMVRPTEADLRAALGPGRTHSSPTTTSTPFNPRNAPVNPPPSPASRWP